MSDTITSSRDELPVVKTLNELLEEWAVHDWFPLQQTTPELANWFAVSNTNGIVAYFSEEREAFRYRLFCISLELNSPENWKR